MMTRLGNARRRMDSDDGASLLLALIFVLVIGIFVAAILPYTSTGLQTAGAVRDVRTTQNAADGAVDQAIDSIRGTLQSPPDCGTPPAGGFPRYTAPDYVPPPPLKPTDVTKAYVEYCNTGLGSTGSDDQPPFAIQTLTGGIDVEGNAPLIVAGPVFSSGDVTIGKMATDPQQQMIIHGDLFAKGNCEIGSPAQIVVDIGAKLDCLSSTPPGAAGNYATPPDPNGADPFAPGGSRAIADPITSVPSPADPPGTCAFNGSVVDFKPGYYSETPHPDSSCTGPGHTVWWFEPGTYYFDFPDSVFKSTQYGDYSDTTDAAWNAANVTIIGGKPLNWDPTSPSWKSSNVENTFFTGDPNHSNLSCDLTQDGVDFIFGGPTNISIGTGGIAPDRIELCPAKVGAQSIALFGQRTGAARSGTPLAGSFAPRVAAPVAGTVPYTLSADAAAANPQWGIDDKWASAHLVGGTVATEISSVDLSSIDTAALNTAIPDGSLILKAQLRVRYYEQGFNVGPPVTPSSQATNRVQPYLTYSLDNGVTNTKVKLTQQSSPGSPVATDGYTIPLALSSSFPRWRALKDAASKLKLNFTADGSALSATQIADSYLDGVQLEVSYVPPAMEATRCAGNAAKCQLLTNKVDDTLFLHGTVYTPNSDLEVAVHNYSSTVFERGVISGSLIAHVSASTKQTLPPFQLPNRNVNRVILFTAYVQSPDDSTYRKRLVAKVRYDDFVARPGGKTAASPGNIVSVLNWTVLR